MNLTVKYFEFFLQWIWLWKIFEFFYNEFGFEKFFNFFKNEFDWKKFFEFFLYSRINFLFFVCKNEKSSHVSETPYWVTMVFFKAKNGLFLKCFRHLRNLIQKFSGAIRWAEHVLRHFRTTCRFDHFVMTGENRALHRIL